MSEEPRATVREIDGQLVLDDPDALEVIKAVNKHNCTGTFELNEERIAHFVQRIEDREMTGADVVIVVLNVDTRYGADIAECLMPGHDWQAYRDRGEVPFARGLAVREGIQDILDAIDKPAAKKLAEMDGIAVVVVDHDVAEVYQA
jgi:hypothetical protein